jgi:AcrR family transcriptional regulator
MASLTPEVLDAAERIVREGGEAALTMDGLAQAAGVSRATLYRQAGSRDALLKRLAERGLTIGARGEVRDRILAAAATVFSRHGLEAGTIEAIAETAGVGAATVYRNFGDKRGLMAAFLKAQAPRRATWELAHKPSGDLEADLLQLSRTLLTFMRDNGPLLRLAMLERARGSDLLASLSQSPDRTIYGCATLLAHYVERGQLQARPPESMARAFLGVLFGFGLFGPLLGIPGTCDVERDAQRAVEQFLDGNRVHQPARRAHRRKR